MSDERLSSLTGVGKSLLEAVIAPEQLAAGNEGGRAEDTERLRSARLRLEGLLHIGACGQGKKSVNIKV